MALGFRDSDALQVVLQSGLCSLDVMSRRAQVALGDDGTLILLPSGALPETTLASLRAAGVSIDAAMPADAREVRCWAEALAPVRVSAGVRGSEQLPSLVLLVTERATELVDLAAELVRLGCDRQELLVAGTVGVARVVDPPTYTVVRAIDREGGLRAYAPDPTGQDAVWTELGFRHPLAHQLRAEQGTLLLIDEDAWRVIPDRDWAPVDEALELTIPGHDVELATRPLPGKRKVALRLRSGRRDVPSLWVIREAGLAVIDRLLDHLPEDIVARLLFAATGGPEPVIVIRARTGRHPAPDLVLDAEAYAPLAQMPDLYAPADALVEPPLRRERLRSIIGVDPGEVVWLVRTEGTGFRVERVVETAFAPLSEWADYVIHRSAAALVPWMRATVFDFAELVSTGVEWAAGPSPSVHQPATEGEARKQARGAAPPPAVEVEASIQVPRFAPPQAPRESQPTGSTPRAQIAIDLELAALEGELVALDAPGDAPERIALFDKLGNAYARLGRRRDAGLCFVRAIWESSGPDATARLDAWIAADLEKRTAARALEQALAQTEPTHDHVRTVAALAARAGAEVARDPHRVQRWLDDHDGELDARALWLARLGLATLAGGDPLGLAHTRDGILGRLAAGLPVERELPAFLRFAGRSGALGHASDEHLTAALDALADQVERTERNRSLLDTAVSFTKAYAGFQLAHGFARIGKHDRARTMAAASSKVLKPVQNDPVHGYLSAAFAARVEQAIAGLPPETPLPEELARRLEKADRGERYKIDRLRDASRILAPLERFDVVSQFLQLDPRGPELAAVRTISDLALRAKAVANLVTVAETSEREREGLIDGIFDTLLGLPEAAATPLLVRTLPLIAQLAEPRRALRHANALVVAGHFGRAELVPQLLAALGTSIRAVTGADLERVMQQSLRALRRIGLRHEIAELLAEAEHALPASRAVDHLRGRLALAAGLAYLGDSARALPIFDQARTALTGFTEVKDVTHRLDLTRALALAYAQAPLEVALGGIAELARGFREITDLFGTNTHYSLSVLHFVESLVLGIASDDLALGEAGRRFVEDDEHLIRRRIHRDLGTQS